MQKLQDADLLSIQQARLLSRSAKKAYQAFSDFSQAEVDTIIGAMAKAGLEHAQRLAQLAVEETGYGNVAHKTQKNLFSVQNVYESIKDLKTVGVIARDTDRKITEIAHPMGVVCAITPTTNPTSTVMFKSLVSVKARNAVVFAPHPAALRCSKEAAILMRQAAQSAGAPEGIISCMDPVTLEGTRALMASEDVSIILATGGTAMVKAAHSFAKPAIGVGPGNTPAYVDRSANLDKAARDILGSKTFDHGVICSSEQAIVVHQDIDNPFKQALQGLGAYFLNPRQTAKLAGLLIRAGTMNPAMVGKTPQFLAGQAGITIPEGTKLLVCPLEKVGPHTPLSREVLCPVVAYYVEKDWQLACKRCIEILNFGGLGHTLAVHAQDQQVIDAFAYQKPVFRILVNTPTSQGAIGATTSLTPSMTLSTGTWGGGISSDNISAKHLINIKRVAYETAPLQPEAESAPKREVLGEEDIAVLVRKVISELERGS